MNRLIKFFPLSKQKSGKKVFIAFAIYLLINLSARLVKEFLADTSFAIIGGNIALIVNIYVYIGIFLLAYNFILNTKR